MTLEEELAREAAQERMKRGAYLLALAKSKEGKCTCVQHPVYGVEVDHCCPLHGTENP